MTPRSAPVLTTRVVLVLVGALVLAYGGWLLLTTQEPPAVRDVVVWAGAAVVLHDAVVVPLVIGCGLVARRLVRRRRAGAALVVLLVVLGPVTIAALPVLGALGAEPDNPTLLPRDQPAGWLAAAGIALLLALGLAASGPDE